MLIRTLLDHYDSFRGITWVDIEDSGGFDVVMWFFFSGTTVLCQLLQDIER